MDTRWNIWCGIIQRRPLRFEDYITLAIRSLISLKGILPEVLIVPHKAIMHYNAYHSGVSTTVVD